MNSAAFYRTYHGHEVSHLEAVFNALSQVVPGLDAAAAAVPRSVVFLAGDSSLDNKYWLATREPAVNGYDRALKPPFSVPDIAHQLNKIFAVMGGSCVAVNGAVEESTIDCRTGGALQPQDVFIRDHITENDVLVVSLGGNDIALKPTFKTIMNMGWLARLSRTDNVADGSAWGLSHFFDLIHSELELYLRAVTAKRKPRLIVPCMIYYPDANPKSESWAGRVLDLIGYNASPRHLQTVIDRVFREAFVDKPVVVPGSRVVPIQLSRVLDGSDSSDYVARVEPSEKGGAKMARLIVDTIAQHGTLPT